VERIVKGGIKMDVTIIFSMALALALCGVMIYAAIGLHTTMPKAED